MDDWTHDVAVFGTLEGGVMIGCLTCSWQKHLGTGHNGEPVKWDDHTTPERIMDEARAHRSGTPDATT